MTSPSTPNIDLNPHDLAEVQRILKEYVPQYEVWAFGSRATWTAKAYSDLDLAIITDKPLSLGTLADLKNAFDESDLSIKVDLVDWATTGKAFRAIIKKTTVVVKNTVAESNSGKTDEWKCTALSDLADLSGGFAFKSQDYAESGRFVLRTLNIGDDGSISRNDAVFLPEILCGQYSRFELRAHDTLFVMVGATLGKIGYIREKDLPALLNQNMWLIRARSGIADPRYVHYAFRHAVKGSLGWASGSARDFVRRDDYRNLEIPEPPLSEQRAIGHILGTLDDKIELNRRMNETLEAMARALFKSWFVDFEPVRAKAEGRDTGLSKEIADLFPDSFEDSELGEVPKGWRVKALSQLCTLGRGSSPRPINDYMNGEIPWIKIADATAAAGPFLFETKEKLKSDGVSNSVKVSPGDLILSNSATCGVPIFVELHGCIHDGWLYFKDLQEITKRYLYHILILMAEHLIHIADGSVQKNLNTNLVGEQLVIVPESAIMDTFEAYAASVFDRIRSNSLESRTLASQRDTLLPKLLTGEVRVKNLCCFTGSSS